MYFSILYRLNFLMYNAFQRQYFSSFNTIYDNNIYLRLNFWNWPQKGERFKEKGLLKVPRPVSKHALHRDKIGYLQRYPIQIFLMYWTYWTFNHSNMEESSLRNKKMNGELKMCCVIKEMCILKGGTNFNH